MKSKCNYARISCLIKKVEPGSYSSGAWVTVDVRLVKSVRGFVNLCHNLEGKKDVRIFAKPALQELFWSNVNRNISVVIRAYAGMNKEVLYEFVRGFKHTSPLA